MTYKTRKRVWPLAVMSLAVFGVLAAVVAMSVLPSGTAQADDCYDDTLYPTFAAQIECVQGAYGRRHRRFDQSPTTTTRDACSDRGAHAAADGGAAAGAPGRRFRGQRGRGPEGIPGVDQRAWRHQLLHPVPEP